MIDSAILTYEETYMRCLSDGMIRYTMETFLKPLSREATKIILSPANGAVENIVKLSVNCGAADSALGSRPNRLSKSQTFAQNIVDCLMKMSTFTAPITKLIRINAETAVMNEAKFYAPSTNVEKKSKTTYHHRL